MEINRCHVADPYKRTSAWQLQVLDKKRIGIVNFCSWVDSYRDDNFLLY